MNPAFERQTRALQIPRDFAIEVPDCRVFVGGKEPFGNGDHGLVRINFDLGAIDFL
jgi:hypothetical protein